MKKLFVLSIKLIPVIQMAGILFSNLWYYLEWNNKVNFTLDYLIGDSLITTILLFICSYTFGFCKWHRLLITANFINITIAIIDIVVGIPVSDFKLLVLYLIISSIFILFGIYHKFIYKNEKCNKHSS